MVSWDQFNSMRELFLIPRFIKLREPRYRSRNTRDACMQQKHKYMTPTFDANLCPLIEGEEDREEENHAHQRALSMSRGIAYL